MSNAKIPTEGSGQYATQAGLRYHLNELHSPIHILPPEVLSVIFHFACTSTPRTRGSGLLIWELPSVIDRTAFVLSAVSSYWRDTAHTTPSLWVNLAIQSSQETAASDAILLQHYITLVGCLNFALDLLFRVPASGFEPISRVLFSPENIQRIKTLRLQDPPLCVIHDLSQLSQLHTLCIWFSICHPPYIDLDLSEACPSLCRVSLEGTHWESVNLPLSVQALVLVHTSSEISISSLYQCPNLVECHLFHSDTYNTDESPPRRSLLPPLTLVHLEVWSWMITEDVWTDDHLIPYLHLPALKTCNIWHDPIGASAADVINFTHRLPHTLLSTLELGGFVNWDLDDFKRLFRNIPSVKVLRVARCSPYSLSQLARALTPDGVTPSAAKPLPQLRDLSATFDELYLRCNAITDLEYSVVFSNMLKKRRENDGHEVHIHIPKNVIFPQTADIQDGPD